LREVNVEMPERNKDKFDVEKLRAELADKMGPSPSMTSRSQTIAEIVAPVMLLSTIAGFFLFWFLAFKKVYRLIKWILSL
jgi:hypothetical protein